jgi:hypothetical protein
LRIWRGKAWPVSRVESAGDSGGTPVLLEVNRLAKSTVEVAPRIVQMKKCAPCKEAPRRLSFPNSYVFDDKQHAALVPRRFPRLWRDDILKSI